MLFRIWMIPANPPFFDVLKNPLQVRVLRDILGIISPSQTNPDNFDLDNLSVGLSLYRMFLEELHDALLEFLSPSPGRWSHALIKNFRFKIWQGLCSKHKNWDVTWGRFLGESSSLIIHWWVKIFLSHSYVVNGIGCLLIITHSGNRVAMMMTYQV